MGRIFNVSAACKPDLHYMVNIEDRLIKIKEMVDRGDYFSINRARQYGKTTTLRALGLYLQNNYVIVDLDFQKLSHGDFESEHFFVKALSREILKRPGVKKNILPEVSKKLRELEKGTESYRRLSDLFECFSDWCAESDKPVVLMIDEVDSASNNQVFLDFLAQLRGCYIDRDEIPTFQSVILAGVYDIKNLKLKIRLDEEHRYNSPWNIGADFLIDMSFSVRDIMGMLEEYEADYKTGMDIREISELIYDYTSGYPFLVSRICKLIDERVAGSEADKKAVWNRTGVLEAVRILMAEKNTLFESLINKLEDYPDLRQMIFSLLFCGQKIVYNPDDAAIGMALMFGFVKEKAGMVVIANRIFETRLYNLFLASSEVQGSEMYKDALRNKNQFVKNGHLDMRLVLEKFVEHFDDLYGDKKQKFMEEDGRRYFLLYLRPIINGVGNYYIEAQTRNMERTDVVVDYLGDQFVIELKLWRGNAYNERGEKQLSDYLDYYHLQKGYMLSFNFNKNKQIGVKEIIIGDKMLIEAVV